MFDVDVDVVALVTSSGAFSRRFRRTDDQAATWKCFAKNLKVKKSAGLHRRTNSELGLFPVNNRLGVAW